MWQRSNWLTITSAQTVTICTCRRARFRQIGAHHHTAVYTYRNNLMNDSKEAPYITGQY